MSTISEAFMMGGYGMWPTLAFGVAALGLSARHAVKPKAELLPLIVGVGTATLLAGALGFVSGLMASARCISELPIAERGPIFLEGLGESLTNMALALMILVLVALATGVGSYRIAQRLTLTGGSPRALAL